MIYFAKSYESPKASFVSVDCVYNAELDETEPTSPKWLKRLRGEV